MTKKNIVKRYRWQPELATSMIYWSLTFVIFFLGVIAVLEELRINMVTVIAFIVFSILFYLGINRYFTVTDTELKIHAILKRNHRKISLSNIEEITKSKYGFSIALQNKREKVFYLMLPKAKEKFIDDLEHRLLFRGTIRDTEKSVGQ